MNGHVLAELNGLELWATDVGNAFSSPYVGARVIQAGPEFGDREAILVIVRATRFT
jgi:hypothetical protein